MKDLIRKKIAIILLISLLGSVLLPSLALSGLELFCERVYKPKADYDLKRFFNDTGNEIYIYTEKEKKSASYIAVMARDKSFNRRAGYALDTRFGIFLFDSKTKEYLMTLDMFDTSSSRCYCIKELGTDYLILSGSTNEPDKRGGEWKYFFDIDAKKSLGKVASQKSYVNDFAIHDGFLYILGSYNDTRVMIKVDPAKADNKRNYSLTTKIDPKVDSNTKRYNETIDLSAYNLPNPTKEDFDKYVTGGNIPYSEEYYEPFSVGATYRDKDKVWFGTSFHSGEGFSGIGGLGYLDTKANKVEFNYYKKIASYSSSAIYADGDYVWIGLYNEYTYGPSGGGVVRYNTKDGFFRRYPVPNNYVVYKIISFDNDLFLMVGGKILVYSDDRPFVALTINSDLKGNPTLNFIDDPNDFDDIDWSV